MSGSGDTVDSRGLVAIHGSGRCQAEGCTVEGAANGASLLKCSRCLGLATKGGSYCRKTCQKTDPSHRAHCDDAKAFLDKTPSENRLLERTLIRYCSGAFLSNSQVLSILIVFLQLQWQKKFVTNLKDLGISALYLPNFLNNADAFYVRITVSCDEKKINIVAIDVRNLEKAGPDTYSLLQDARLAQEPNRSSSSPGALFTIYFAPVVQISDSLFKADARMNPSAQAFVLSAAEMHSKRAYGLPVINWRDSFMAASNGTQLPLQETYGGPSCPNSSYIYKTDSAAMSQFIQLHIESLTIASIQTILLTGRPSKDHVLIVYVRKATDYAKTGSFQAISAAHYSVEDKLYPWVICQEQGGASGPVAFLQMTGEENLWVAAKMIIPDDKALHSHFVELSIKDEMEWQRPLLRAMNGRWLVNLAAEEASRDEVRMSYGAALDSLAGVVGQ